MFNAAEVMNSPAFKASLGKAQELIGDRQKLAGLVNEANAKLDKMAASKGPIGDAVKAGRAGVRMIRAYMDGRYEKAPLKSLAAIAGALLYFIRNDDLIDDDTPFIGYLDDAAVIALALKVVQGDLDDFLAWESQDAPAPAGGA